MDHRDLRRVHGYSPLKAQRPLPPRVGQKPVGILDVEKRAVDRRHHPRGPGGHDYLPARVGELRPALGQLNAQRNREVAEPEDRGHRPVRGLVEDLVAATDSPRRLEDRQQPHAAGLHAVGLLGRRQRPVGLGERLGVLDLRDHHGVEVRADHCGDVVVQASGLDPVDPDRVHLVAAVALDRRPGRRPGRGLTVIGHRILEIDHDHVSAEARHLGQLALVAAGDEQQRTHQLFVPIDLGHSHAPFCRYWPAGRWVRYKNRMFFGVR